MKRQRDSLAKILRLQEKLHKLSTWKAGALDRKRVELAEAQKQTIAAIDHDAVTHRLLVARATRRLRARDNQIEAGKAQHAAQTQQWVDRGRHANVRDRSA